MRPRKPAVRRPSGAAAATSGLYAAGFGDVCGTCADSGRSGQLLQHNRASAQGGPPVRAQLASSTALRGQPSPASAAASATAAA
jgi:hypothetical protein